MDSDIDFYTLSGYALKNPPALSASMEDYLEMIARLCAAEGFARVGALAERLNVKPSSASKMVGRLRGAGLVAFERYGVVTLTPKGEEEGRYLLQRHQLLARFFCLLNRSSHQLEQVERVEHFLSRETVANLKSLVERMEEEWGYTE